MPKSGRKHPWPRDQVAPRREAIAKALADLLSPSFADADDEEAVRRLVAAGEAFMGPVAEGCTGADCELPLALAPASTKGFMLVAVFLTGRDEDEATRLGGLAMERLAAVYARRLGIGTGFGPGPTGQA